MVYVVATPSAVKKITEEEVPALIAVGVARAAPGINAVDAEEAVDVVLLPLGVTTKVYDVPFVSPVIEQVAVVLRARGVRFA
jgi:hypothetical protein